MSKDTSQRPNLTPYVAALLIGGIFFYILKYFLGNTTLLSSAITLLAGLSTGLSLFLDQPEASRQTTWKKRFQALGVIIVPGVIIMICLFSIKASHTSETLITCAMAALAFLMAGKAEHLFIKHIMK